PIAFLPQRLAGLGAGIVEFARLTDDDRACADDQDRGDVRSFRHPVPTRGESEHKKRRRQTRASLVSPFRRSYPFAAPAHTNVGTKGTIATRERGVRGGGGTLSPELPGREAR